MNNSVNSTYLFEETREEEYVKGTTLEYNCADDHKLSQPETVCDVDGKWTPEVFCHPGKIILYVSSLDSIIFYRNEGIM